MDLTFYEVEAPAHHRTWMWLGVAGIATLMLAVFVVSPSAAGIVGLIALASLPLAVIAGTERATAPLATAGAVVILVLCAAGVSLAVTSRLTVPARPAQSAQGGAPATGSQPVPAPQETSHPGPAQVLPAPADIKPPSAEPTPQPAVHAEPVPAPSSAPDAGPAPTDPGPAPAEAGEGVAEPAAPVEAPAPPSASRGWGSLSDESRAQLCALARATERNAPPGLCR